MKHFLQQTIRHILLLVSRGAVILLLFIALIFLIIKLQSDAYIRTAHKDLPPAHTAIVLGAGLLTSGKLSLIFKDRVDIAAELYKIGKVKTILITGDDSTPTHNEVNPARDYLMTKGVPSEAIFLDHAGFDTYSSMYRAREIFLVDSAIVITQSFHLPRSVFLARNLSIDAYGTPADQHAYRFKNNIREVIANVKAVFNVLYQRKPKYLGEEIPITGKSDKSI